MIPSSSDTDIPTVLPLVPEFQFIAPQYTALELSVSFNPSITISYHLQWYHNQCPASPLCGSSIYSSNCTFLNSYTVAICLQPSWNSSSLKSACPHGVFMSLTPGDPTVWPGVIFVRKGPYASCILRFQISFPSNYPTLPPLVTFSTDIFHPLITPLTTYMYTTDIQDTGTVSATDEERLPPGGFSLRHGFPSWFGRGSRRSVERARSANIQTPIKDHKGASEVASPEGGTGSSLSPTPGQSSIGKGAPRRSEVGIYEILRYIRSTFDDADVLDDVSLQAAGNPGAWHAWRTHRIKSGNLQLPTADTVRGTSDQSTSEHRGASDSEGAHNQYGVTGGTATPVALRRPGEWNWDGVWELRVKKGIEASVAEAALYGNAPADDLIRFLHMQEDEVATIKDNIRRSVESSGGGTG